MMAMSVLAPDEHDLLDVAVGLAITGYAWFITQAWTRVRAPNLRGDLGVLRPSQRAKSPFDADEEGDHAGSLLER